MSNPQDADQSDARPAQDARLAQMVADQIARLLERATFAPDRVGADSRLSPEAWTTVGRQTLTILDEAAEIAGLFVDAASLKASFMIALADDGIAYQDGPAHELFRVAAHLYPAAAPFLVVIGTLENTLRRLGVPEDQITLITDRATERTLDAVGPRLGQPAVISGGPASGPDPCVRRAEDAQAKGYKVGGRYYSRDGGKSWWLIVRTHANLPGPLTGPSLPDKPWPSSARRSRQTH